MDIEVNQALLERAMKKKMERNAMRERVAQLVKTGCTRAEILVRLNISSGYYYRLLSEIRGSVRGPMR